MELWDLYDEHRQPLGRTHVRGTEFQEGEYYVCTEVWVIDPEGKILIQQRHPNKKLGGWWGFTGGGVEAGETTLQAAVREIEEEIGLHVKEGEMHFLTTFQAKNYFMDIYVVKKEVDTNALVLQEDEVIDVKFVTSDEFRRMFEAKVIVKSAAKRYELYQNMLCIE